MKTFVHFFSQRTSLAFCLLLSVLSAKSYPGVIVTVNSLTLSGNNIAADSFDSGDPYHSTWQTNYTFKSTNKLFFSRNYGYYPTNPSVLTSVAAPDYATEPYFRKDNAYVESSGAISAGNLNVCGYVDSGSQIPSIGPNGTVGDNLNWIGNGITCDLFAPANNGIQPGHFTTNFSATLPDVRLPNTNGAPWALVPRRSVASAPFYGSTNIDPNAPYSFFYVITNGAYGGNTNYEVYNTGGGGTPVNASILVIGTNINLWLPYGLNFNGTTSTIWVDTNSDVTIYTSADFDTTTGTGNMAINNVTKYVPALRIFGLTNCTLITLSRQPVLTAFVYAPEATVLFTGGGGSYYDFVGGIYCSNLMMSGNMNFHYDEAIPGQGLNPKIMTSQPANRVAAIGSNVTFTASVSRGSPVFARWFFNQTNVLSQTNLYLPGLTNISFTLTNVQPTNGGNYMVICSNTAGTFASITSYVATLTVGSAPSITTQPTNQTVTIGATATFSVAANGSSPLSYRWFTGTNAISTTNSTATNATLILSNVQTNQAGTYFVVVSNALGSITSTNAILTMAGSPPFITLQPSDQTNNGAATVTFSVQATGTAPLSYQWNFNGAPMLGQNSTNLVLGGIQSTQAGNYSVTITNAWGSTNSVNAVLTVAGSNPPPFPPVIFIQPSNQVVHAGSNVTFTVAASGYPAVHYQWIRWVNYGPFPTWLDGETNSFLTLTNVQFSTNNIAYYAIITNTLGTVYSSNAVLTIIGDLPVIITQPTDQTIVVYSNVTFTVEAAGTAPLYYQWLYNGLNFGIATTNASLMLSNVPFGGNYSVVVTNAFGSVTSSVAVLTTLVWPIITAQPTNQTAVAGSNAVFTVAAYGTPPPAYQWKFNGTNLLDQTNASLILHNVQLSQAGNYWVRITNSVAATNSFIAVLAVTPSPTPVISLLSFSDTHKPQLSLEGVPGYSYIIQASTNFSDWQPMITNVAPFTFTDTNADEFSPLFYRALYLQ